MPSLLLAFSEYEVTGKASVDKEVGKITQQINSTW